MKTKHCVGIKRPNLPRSTKITNYIGLVALGGLAVLGLTALAPTISHDAHAEPLTADLSTKTTANLYSMLSIALSNNIDIDITPKSTGAIGVGKARLNVTTNNITGYSIYLSTVDESNSLNAIDNEAGFTGAEGATYAINALEGTTTYNQYLSNQANLNTWGYALTSVDAGTDDTVYTGLDNAKGDNIYYTKSTTSNDSYDLNIAVAVDASLPAGGYRNGIVVSAVANPISISGFKSIYYMQEMTPEICAEAKEHEEGQLVDKRDHKIYWVGKLKDGNCWMTQNLDLDLSTDVALTPEDTNVTAAWTPEVSTSTEIYQVQNPDNSRQTPQNSYDPGAYVYKDFSQKTACDTYVGPSECHAVFTDVSDYHPGFVATDTTTVDPATSTYDSHYHIGNYYEPNAYYVGKSDLTVAQGTLNEDICPKNWRLPSSALGTGDLTFQNTEWYKLVAAYGWDSGYEKNTEWANFYYTLLSTSSQNIEKKPLYLAFFGTVEPTSRTASAKTRLKAGNSARFPGNGKSSTATPTIILISGKNLYPGSAATEYIYASPVRCIAK